MGSETLTFEWTDRRQMGKRDREARLSSLISRPNGALRSEIIKECFGVLPTARQARTHALQSASRVIRRDLLNLNMRIERVREPVRDVRYIGRRT